jgi:hypothetical protein
VTIVTFFSIINLSKRERYIINKNKRHFRHLHPPPPGGGEGE